MKPAWIQAARYSGIDPDEEQVEQMERFASWLVTEAREAGGIGPGETDRVDRRHLADSLLFASQIPAGTGTVWDLGSGAGLPGVPLAICMPQRRFLLIDRSRRRCDLIRRSLRILGLSNCQVMRSEVTRLSGETDVIVSRACMRPGELGRVVDRHLTPGGVAIVGGSWQHRPEHEGWDTIEIPPDTLDQTIWLLIMRRE